MKAHVMIKYRRVILIIIPLLLICCLDKNQGYKCKEQNIYNDIFSELLDEIIYDKRKTPIPPPPPKNDSRDEIDKMKEAFSKAKIEHEKYLDTTNFRPLKVFLNDTVFFPSGYKFDELSINQKKEFIDNINSIDTLPIIIDVKEINIDSSKYKLENLTSLKEPLQSLIKKESGLERYKKEYGGIVGISKIIFNSNKSKGLFFSYFDCGKYCGCGFIVFVQQTSEKWKIYDIINTGCP